MKLQWFIVSLFLLFSCSSSEKNDDTDLFNQFVTFEKVDSIVVRDILASVFLFQGVIDNQFIFRDHVSSEVYIFDDEGKLISRWNKEGDVPGKFSMSSGNFLFDREGRVVVLDIMHGLKVLELDGNVIKDFSIYQFQVGLAGAFSLFDSQQVIEKDGQEYLLYSLDIIEEFDGNYPAEFLRERKNLLLTNLNTNETQKVIPFPQSSIFLNGKVFFFRDFRPVFYFDQLQQRLLLMFQGENVLYTYDWSGDSPVLIDSKTIDLEGFEIATGFEPGSIQLGKISEFDKRAYASTIVNLSKVGSDFLLSYSGTPQDKAAIASVIAGGASDEIKTKLRNETPRGTFLLRPDGELIPVNLPPMHYGSFKVIGEDIYWMKKTDPDVEAEEFTLYRGKLKIEKLNPTFSQYHP
ncbi:NHL repeat-containing protein [Algoriphagus algorifonticola]|uniref:hypothetical protein n=1 Tax=Algoriphagus algorifonticola TaxID=2593007 RepID=UPI0011A9B80A|nr:hypothetical protein [Algoriphagus algorifonticola]